MAELLCNHTVEYDLLGEAPIQTQATAQKRPETPMGITGIVDLRLFLMWLKINTGLFFTLYSAKAPRRITESFFCALFFESPLTISGDFFVFNE